MDGQCLPPFLAHDPLSVHTALGCLGRLGKPLTGAATGVFLDRGFGKWK